ncbi:ATP-binding protein [Luteimonas sp. FCS-9]|uniref:sensor histidine kinase n=1 Tax=Luteimonas sp. FCS-9 TaxID=1547516 RepID=UPI00063E88EC|nr:ATP-binding protein [Luteimonas sp. FCS-9]KLJ02328.1 hypothetical protein WQ56_01870 [Luteimonas sp. FCS-9]
MLQWVLVFCGVYQPLSTAIAWWRFDGLLDSVSLWLTAVHTTLLWSCFVAARRGATRLAAVAFVLGSLLVLSVAYPRWGLALQGPQHWLQLLPVLIGAVLLGRRVLWTAAAWMAALVAIGAWQDAQPLLFAPGHVVGVALAALSAVLGLGLVAFVVDQALVALHESLALARRRGSDLAQVRDRLLLEMEQRERQQAQLLHAQKMEAVGRLASSIAHDFNHLLALVMGHAGRGLATDDPDEMKAALRSAEAAARRAGAVSHRLVDFSRHDDAWPETFDAVEAIAELAPMLRQTFPSTVDVALDLDAGTGLAIRFDRAQLELVLLGLATNAQQAMPDGGRFTLSVALRAPDRVEIVARDTGRGMDAATRARCLEPFFTTRPAGQGAGLGLAVAADLVRTAGGDIEIDSAPGEGSTFRIVLPLQALSRENNVSRRTRRTRASGEDAQRQPGAGTAN